MVSESPEYYERLDAAFAAEGFRPGAFAAFGQLLNAPRLEPLSVDELDASPLGDLMSPFLFPLEDELAVVTHLRGLRDSEALRARLAGLNGVHLLDQRTFVNDIFSEFRVKTLQQMAVGAVLVGLRNEWRRGHRISVRRPLAGRSNWTPRI